MELEMEMLMHAARSGSVQVLQEMNDVDVNQKDGNDDTALILATKYHQTEVVKLLLEKGADANAIDREGNTALMWAAFNEKYHH